MPKGYAGRVQKDDWNAEYYQFLDSIFEKNQWSALPAPRDMFYNIAQEVFRELQTTFEREGVLEAFERLRIKERNGRSRRKEEKKVKKSVYKAFQFDNLDPTEI